MAPIEVLFSVPDGVAPVEMGAGNVLPSAGAPTGYTFAGWSESPIEETTTKPIIFEAGSVYSGDNHVLYAVYTYSEIVQGSSNFIKVTENLSDWSGQYLIVYEDGMVAFNGGLTTLDVTSNTVAVVINNGTIAVTDALRGAMFTIAPKDSNGNYTIKSASGYYIGRNSTDNGLHSDTSTQYSSKISYNAEGYVDIKAANGPYLRYNATSGQNRFRYFKASTYTDQKAIQLYKLVEIPTSTTTYYLTMSTVECDHEYESTVTHPTCTVGGYTTHTCIKCGESYTDSVVSATGHSYDEGVIITQPACKVEGLKKYSCSCGHSYTEVVEALSHNFVDGYCSLCGKEFTIIFDFGPKGEEKDADGNAITSVKTYTEGEYNLVITPSGKVYTAARDVKGNVCIKLGSSSATGSITFTVPDEVIYVIVNVAGYKANTVTIKVNGESYKITTFGNDGEYTPIRVDTTETKTVTVETTTDGYRAMIDSIEFGVSLNCKHKNTTTTTVDATCTEAGSTTVTCKDCGETISTTEIPALGHKYDNACDADCNVCGAIRTPAAHTGGTATCEKKAVCSVCGESYGELASHTPGAAATCTTAQSCTVCGAELAP